jgi:hypothetical protein
MQAYWLVSRGLLPVFSLRGSDDAIHWLITLGTNARFLGTAFWFFVAGWLLTAALGVGLCLWRTRTLGVRILIAMLAVHCSLAAIAGGVS